MTGHIKSVEPRIAKKLGRASLLGIFLSVGMVSAALAAGDFKIGNTIPYSGPLAGFSTNAKAAAAFFKKVNEEKLFDREIKFLSLDDAYTPPKTLEQTRKLVENDKVDVLAFNLGSPTNAAIWDYASEKKVPHLFINTGNTMFNDPEKHPYTIKWLPSYQTEARSYALYILKNIPNAKIAVLYQNDQFGKDFLKGFKDGLGAENQSRIVTEQAYQASDPTVDSQIITMKNSGANVAMFFSAPKTTAQALKKTHSLGWTPTQFVASVATSIKSVLTPAGLAASKNVLSSTVFKSAADPRWKDDPAIAEYKAFLKKYYPEADPNDDFVVMGLLQAQTLFHVLKQSGKDLSRENVMKQATSLKDVSLPMLIPGITMSTSAKDYNVFKKIQLIKFDGEKWASFHDLIDADVK